MEHMFAYSTRRHCHLGAPVTTGSDLALHSPECPRPESLVPNDPLVTTEAVVRQALRAQVLDRADHPAEAVYEFWVPLSNERADVVVIGRAMAGYEIKTDRDTLRRLPRQAAAYGRLFDTCTVVVGERHLPRVVEVVPDWWGIVGYRNEDRPISFHTVRAATPNRSVDPETLVRLLWREEVRAAVVALGTDPDPSGSRASMWQQLLGLIDLGQLKEIVRAAILGRDPQSARIPTRRFCEADISL